MFIIKHNLKYFIVSEMDLRDPNYIPDGWIKTIRNKRTVFMSPKPERVIVQGKAMLKDLQRQGRFVEVDLDRIDFRGLVAQVSEARVLGAVDDEAMEVDEVEAEASVEMSTVKRTGAEQQGSSWMVVAMRVLGEDGGLSFLRK